MTRRPFDSSELGRNDPEMDRIGAHLERYAQESAGEPPLDLVMRIQATVDDEPLPARGWWASLLAAFAGWHQAARLAMATAVVAAAAIGALVVGDLADRARNNTGATPVPSVNLTPSPLPTVTPTQTPTPVPTPTPTPSASESAPASVDPTASDDDDEVETPEPTESDSDNSGPGGGGGDNSGPGGGD